MAGSISLSLSQQFNEFGAPLSGGRLYFYAAGTTTPQSAYQDVALTLPYANPIELDSAGRIPPFYLADGQIKIRLTDSAGVVQVAADNLLVVGASSGSGSPPSVDATTILASGDFKLRYGTGALSGFVRANGRTIGSASSGGTERANADCQSLFEYLWGADSTLSVSTGRGASAADDWAANKNITLPDLRGRTIAGLGDMGSTDSGRITSGNFGANPATLGAVGGAEKHPLSVAQIPTLTTASTGTATAPSNNFATGTNVNNIGYQAGATNVNILGNPGAGDSTADVSVSGTTSGTGGATGGDHLNMQPTMLMTIYIKL